MISVPKIVLIILIAIAVWLAFRWLNRVPPGALRRRQPSPSPPPRHPNAIEDLVACRTCGAYVAANARGCGKPGCPQPR